MRAWLNDLGIVSALGVDKAEHLQAFCGLEQTPLTQGSGLHYGVQESDQHGEPAIQQDPYVGLVQAIPLTAKQRNNRLIDLALQQLAPTLTRMRARYSPARIAVVVGTSTADIYDGERAREHKAQTGCWPEGYHYNQQALDAPAVYIKEKLGLEGIAYSISTACSSSAKALNSAKGLLAAGLADAVICGGADSLCQLTINGFSALASTSHGLCQPFGAERDGINIGEGAALFVMSRERDLGESHCALLGSGASSDAHHMSAPEPNGHGAIEAMRQALANAKLSPNQIDYLNAHGTATPKNDEMEAKAIAELFADPVPVSSTKHLTGHTLGAAGAIEAGLCWLLIEQQRLGAEVLPSATQAGLPLPWHQGYELDANLAPIQVLQQPITKTPKICMSNSFAFGGNNASLIIGEVDA
ncbi:beta-ketoacyl-ACP synthase [Pseudoalteromonas sp. T1lg75]|uniref:beta-ketoacyl-ACP synthase n=1 Tax=Pseudoalteromonas sp. T1lg75 TaxID=2077102 RepID=UPI000CF5E37E|nr:beta-ketoacyl-ACP synthase [Pseudoalteromonas sp. T1lg75]